MASHLNDFGWQTFPITPTILTAFSCQDTVPLRVHAVLNPQYVTGSLIKCFAFSCQDTVPLRVHAVLNLQSSMDRPRVVVGSLIKCFKKTGKLLSCVAAFPRRQTILMAFSCFFTWMARVSSLTSSLCIKGSILVNKQYDTSY